MDIFMNFFTNLIDLSLLYMFLKYFIREKTQIAKSLAIIGILVIFNTFINAFFGLGNLWGFLIMFAIIGLLYNFVFNNKLIFIYLYLLVALIFMFIIELIVINLILFIFKLSPEEIYQINTYRIVAIIFAKVSYLFFILLIVRNFNAIKYFNDKLSVPLTVILLFNVIIIYMSFILYRYIKTTTASDYFSIFAMALGAVLFTWFVFMIMRKIMIQSQKELIWKMREKEYQNQRMYFINLQEILTTLKAQRHDFNNHMSTVYGMIQLNKNDDAKKYILRLVDSVTELNDILQANHPVISSLINIKYQLAKKNKINMKLNLSMPEDLNLDYIDLSIVIGNLLDNAIEACRNMETGEKTIEVEIMQNNEYIIFNIINSKNSDLYRKEDSARYTTKADQENHGFGLSNVKQVVNKYKGMMNIEDLKDKFKVNIALPNKINVK